MPKDVAMSIETVIGQSVRSRSCRAEPAAPRRMPAAAKRRGRRQGEGPPTPVKMAEFKVCDYPYVPVFAFISRPLSSRRGEALRMGAGGGRVGFAGGGSELVARLCVCAFVGRVGCEGCYSSCEV